MKLNSKIIETLILEKDYGYLKELLEEFFSVPNNKNRLYFNVLKTLEHLEVIEQSIYYELPNVKYENDRTQCLKRFGEAMKYKDFQEAYELIDDCIKFLIKHKQSTHEMYIYKLLLEDMMIIQKEKIEACKPKMILRDNIKQLREINKEFNILIIPEVKRLIEEIVYTNEDIDCTQFIYMLEIISMIEQVKNYRYIDRSYFSNLNKEFENKPDFYEKLSYGDYIRSYEYIIKKENREKLIKNSPSLNVKLTFKLLKLLNELIENNDKHNFKPNLLADKIADLLAFDETEKSLEEYLDSDLPKDEEIIARLLIINKYNGKKEL